MNKVIMAVVIPMSSLVLKSISMNEIILLTLIYNHYGKCYWIHKL